MSARDAPEGCAVAGTALPPGLEAQELCAPPACPHVSYECVFQGVQLTNSSNHCCLSLDLGKRLKNAEVKSRLLFKYLKAFR